MARHKLSNKDLEAMTATCSVDGPVKLTRAGSSVRCSVAAANAHQRWVRLNPDKAKANRATRSAHRLTSFDETTSTGECPVCGTVGVTPKGRGWMCSNRAYELWRRQQDVPQARCGRCSKVWLRADGSCPACDNEDQLVLSRSIRASRDLRAVIAQAGKWGRIEDEGYSRLIDTVNHTPAVEYAMEPFESAEPGWRTLGGGTPAGVPSRRFVERWWQQYGHLVEEGA